MKFSFFKEDLTIFAGTGWADIRIPSRALEWAVRAAPSTVPSVSLGDVHPADTSFTTSAAWPLCAAFAVTHTPLDPRLRAIVRSGEFLMAWSQN